MPTAQAGDPRGVTARKLSSEGSQAVHYARIPLNAVNGSHGHRLLQASDQTTIVAARTRI
jgi:hypothetical protein